MVSSINRLSCVYSCLNLVLCKVKHLNTIKIINSLQLHSITDSSQMPPNMTSIFNDEYSFPRDSILTDASFNCTAENGRVQYVFDNLIIIWNNNMKRISSSLLFICLHKFEKENCILHYLCNFRKYGILFVNECKLGGCVGKRR